MKQVLLKIKQTYRKKEQQKIGDKFIEIMEIIYAIILACGVVKIVEELGKNISIMLLCSILISGADLL